MTSEICLQMKLNSLFPQIFFWIIMGNIGRQKQKQQAFSLEPNQLKELPQRTKADQEEKIETVMFMDSRKREAEALYPKVIEDLVQERDLDEMKGTESLTWTKIQICEYLKDKLEMDELEEVNKVIDMGELDLCKIIIYDYLRFDEAEQIFPHIERFIHSQNTATILQKQKDAQEQILVYIKEKVSPQQFSSVQNLLENKAFEEALLLIKSLLRKREADFIIPKIKQMYLYKTSSLNSQGTAKQVEKKISFSQEIRDVSEILLSPQQMLLQTIKEQFGEQLKQYYQTVKQHIQERKLSAAFQIMKYVKGQIVAEKLIKQARAIIDEVKNQPVKNSKLILKNPDGMQIYELKTQPLPNGIPENEISNVLVVGMTGVGKSTFLNSLVNKLMGVEMTDSFRYVIVNDFSKEIKVGGSVTSEVTIYGIPKQGKMKKAIRLIDAPGLGDTAGLKKDQEIIDKIKRKIESSIPYLNVVIYVFKSSETRITKESEYVMGQVMGLFGKDIAPNILFVLTFADNMEPNVKASLETSFKPIIQKIQQKHSEWFIKVNNSAMFSMVNPQDPVDVSFYNTSSLCLQKVIDRIYSSNIVTTVNTQNVLKKRKDIEKSLQAFDDAITIGLQKQREIKNIAEQVTKNITVMNSMDYNIKYQEEQIRQIATTDNVTSCMTCKFSCHVGCVYSNNADKKDCSAMQNENCKICPERCHWTSHINDHLIVKRQMVQVEKINEDLYSQYQVSSQSKDRDERLLIKLIKEYINRMMTIMDYCKRMKQAREELDKIQLMPVNKKTVVEYIDVLIATERANMHNGFEKRIQEYMIIQKQQQRADQMLNQSEADEIKNFEQQLKEKISLLIPNKQLAAKMLSIFVQLYSPEPVYSSTL